MFYQRFGTSKKWLVFLHGWGADHKSFLWLKDNFEEEYSLLFLDFPGFGKSAHPDFKMSVNDYVFELKKILDQFEIESLNLIAHSFGGRVAIKFLFFYQQKYDSVKLCLIDSAGVLPRRGLKYWWRVNRYKSLTKKAVRNSALLNKVQRYGSEDYKKLDEVMKQTFVLVVNENLLGFAKFINCKTLIVWGDKDRDTRLYMAKKLKRAILGSRLVILKGAGHFSFLEKKEEFVIILDRFLKNL